jgi:hypothetical protein
MYQLCAPQMGQKQRLLGDLGSLHCPQHSPQHDPGHAGHVGCMAGRGRPHCQLVQPRLPKMGEVQQLSGLVAATYRSAISAFVRTVILSEGRVDAQYV